MHPCASGFKGVSRPEAPETYECGISPGHSTKHCYNGSCKLYKGDNTIKVLPPGTTIPSFQRAMYPTLSSKTTTYKYYAKKRDGGKTFLSQFPKNLTKWSSVVLTCLPTHISFGGGGVGGVLNPFELMTSITHIIILTHKAFLDKSADASHNLTVKWECQLPLRGKNSGHAASLV